MAPTKTKTMKTELSKIAQDIEQGTITEQEARKLLLCLLGSGGALQFIDDMFKLINDYAKNGLSKPDLLSAKEWMNGSCEMIEETHKRMGDRIIDRDRLNSEIISKRKLVCPKCGCGEENHKRMGDH